MITLTIREAIMDRRTISPGYVYVVRDGEIIFYVGISQDPTFRLCQHVGIADAWNTYTYPRSQFLQDMETGKAVDSNAFICSPVGICIRENAPESLAWSFDIYQQADAVAVIRRTELPTFLPRLLLLMEQDWYDQRSLVEKALIEELYPYPNISTSVHTRNLPEQYQRRRR